MTRFPLKTAFAGFLVLLLSGCMSPEGANNAAKRQNAGQMRSDTLAKLYQIHPQARQQIAKSAGYGVFSNVGVNLLLVSAGNGWGIVRNNRTGKDVYMKMVSAGLGLGLGAKDFRGVFVFTSKEALEQFTEKGWAANAQADATAKDGKQGKEYTGAIDVAPGIKLYQLTERGLALQATIQGTKYWRDKDLNS
jgi:lipid-binding SYLF domain-containing protein